MATNSESAKKGAQTRIARMRAKGGEKAVSEHYAKLAAAGGKKNVKKGLAVLKETDPEKFKEIVSMGGKSRWNNNKNNKKNPVQRKVRNQRRTVIDKAREKDEFYDRMPKGTKRQSKFEEEGDTGW